MTEKVKIGTKEFRIIHNDDGTKDVSLKGYTGKYYTIYKKVSEFINLGWWYIIKHDDWVDVPSEFWGTLAKKCMDRNDSEQKEKSDAKMIPE